MEEFNEYKTKKRYRTILSLSQTKYLQKYFFSNTFPTKEEREEVARILDMPPRTIQIWFQNMRQKVKNKCNEKNGLLILAESALKILERRENRKNKKI